MSAYKALQAAQAADVDVHLEGGRLKLKAPKRPPEHVLRLLEANKPRIMTVLGPDDAARAPYDWKLYHQERAAIAERGFSRRDAETVAFHHAADRWQAFHQPEVADPGICSRSPKEIGASHNALIAGANGKTGTLHKGCAARWRTLRRQEPLAAVG